MNEVYLENKNMTTKIDAVFLPFAINHSEEFLSRINFDEGASFFTLFPSTISCNSLLEGRLVFYCKVIVKYWFGCYLNLNVFY